MTISRKAFCAALLAATAANPGMVVPRASAQAASVAFDLPSQDLATMLRTLARQSGREILFASEDVRGKRSPSIRGIFTAEQAVRRAIGGSGLVVQEQAGALVVRTPSQVAQDRGDEPAITVTGTRNRRRRDAVFPPGIFADPAWDLMLDLYVARIERRRISVSSACIAAAVPMTTALRWIALLEARDLLVRLADSDDRRRAYIGLAPNACALVETWLAGLLDICLMDQ